MSQAWYSCSKSISVVLKWPLILIFQSAPSAKIAQQTYSDAQIDTPGFSSSVSPTRCLPPCCWSGKKLTLVLRDGGVKQRSGLKSWFIISTKLGRKRELLFKRSDPPGNIRQLNSSSSRHAPHADIPQASHLYFGPNANILCGKMSTGRCLRSPF